jgi:hypothetical protein
MVHAQAAARALVLLLLASGTAWAGSEELDQARAAWRYRREVRLPRGPGDPSLAVLPLPPDLLARCQPEARDLRLLSGDGTELPYLISHQEGQLEVERYPGVLSDVRIQPWQRAQWEVDLGGERTFDTVELSIPEQDFARRATLEVASADRAFRLLRDDLAVFDWDWRWGRRVHHTTVSLGAPARARFLRVTLWDPSAPRVSLRGVDVRRTTARPGQRWRREVPLRQVPAPRGQSRYKLDLPAGLPIDQVEIAAEDPIFVRRVQLVEEPASPARPPAASTLGEGDIYRVLLPAQQDRGAPLRGEELRFPARRPGGGAVYLQVQDRDSPPLRGLRVAVLGVADQLVFPRPRPGPAGDAQTAEATLLHLYYGNSATRAPLYDVELLRGWLERYHGEVAVGEIAAEVENPRHRPAPPLGFVQGAGAALEVGRWRLLQRLRAPERADLYGLTLSPEALAALRPDLGDLRIVDGQGRQVPYVLEPEASERAIPLRVEPAAAPDQERAQAQEKTHRHLLRSDIGGALPFVALELRFDRAFFSRPARLLRLAEPDPATPAGDIAGERALWQGTLARRGDDEEGPQRLFLGSAGRLGALTLEIDDGDDAPLGVRGAMGLLRLPRVACKLQPDPAGYRVLLGNAEAEPPRYDIETLRQQVLDYAAVPLTAEAITQNPGYRPRAGDYLRAAPPTLLLWGALGLAVAGLLLVTARLLRARSE